MNRYIYPETLAETLPKWQFLRQAGADKDWMMLKTIGWLVTAVTLALFLWQAAASDPLWPPAVSATLLVTIGVLAGLRLGSDSAAAYTRDLQRLNRVLVDQNRNLEEANAALLRQVSVKASKSA